jgi:type 1 glutamine amidotransferase
MNATARALVPGLLALAVVAPAGDELFLPPPRETDAVKALLVTGGHDHDVAFYSVLDGDAGLAAWVDPHPNAFATAPLDDTDVVVLYDMPSAMSPEQRRGLRAFVEGGGGVVALHHAIAGRTGWRWWWEEVIGGRYLTEPDGDRPASTYQHDVEIQVTVVAEHPVTVGVSSFRILDETYKGMWISPEVQTLLTTDHPTSDEPVAWVSPYPKARVVFIQLGHGREAHLHPAFRRLVRNAVFWAAGREAAP